MRVLGLSYVTPLPFSIRRNFPLLNHIIFLTEGVTLFLQQSLNKLISRFGKSRISQTRCNPSSSKCCAAAASSYRTCEHIVKVTCRNGHGRIALRQNVCPILCWIVVKRDQQLETACVVRHTILVTLNTHVLHSQTIPQPTLYIREGRREEKKRLRLQIYRTTLGEHNNLLTGEELIRLISCASFPNQCKRVKDVNGFLGS